MVPYLSALGVGTIAFWTIGLGRVLIFGSPTGDDTPITGLVVLVPFTFIVALLTTLVPFVLLRAVALFLKLRCWVYSVACGILLGVAEAAMLVTPHWLDWQAWARNASLGENLALSGALGGVAYWWMAVRKPKLQMGDASPPE